MDVFFTPTQLTHSFTALNLPSEDIVMLRDPTLTPGSVAALQIGGGSLVRSIFGTSGNDSIEFWRDSRATGSIELGSGNDVLILGRSQPYFSYVAGFAVPALSLQGGAGSDLLEVVLRDQLGFDGSTTTGFETLVLSVNEYPSGNLSGVVGNAVVNNLSEFERITVNSPYAATTYVGPMALNRLDIGNANLPGAVLEFGTTRMQVVLSSDVTFGSILGNPAVRAGIGSWWLFQYNMNVVSQATILGDVALSGLDDIFDGRGGTVGGRILGVNGIDRIWGGSGNDWIVADGILYGMDGNDTIQSRSTSAANLLFGGAGDDTLIGGGLLDGGAGADTFDATGASDSATVTYAAATSDIGFDMLAPSFGTGDAAGDVFFAVETVKGSAFNDTMRGTEGANQFYGEAGADTLEGRGGDDSLWGGAGDDILLGGAGNDILHGDDGVDSMDGGDGIDQVSYEGAIGAVIIDLRNQAANAGVAAGETLISIETIVGGAFGDTLRGDSGNNSLHGKDGADLLEGFDGDDILIGGNGVDYIYGGDGNDLIGAQDGGSYIEAGAGNDTIVIGNFSAVAGGIYVDGGSGFDFVSYAGVQSVVVNLTTPGSNSGAAQGDNLIGIEGVVGSDAADQLTGDAGDNWIYAGRLGFSVANAGDTINGMDGNDFLFGADAADTINGGNGNDAIYGHGGNNQLNGGNGDDVLYGGWGYETLDGGDGNDHLLPGVGKDTLIGGAGFDFVHFVGVGLGLTVDLVNTAGNNADAEGDSFSGIEGVVTTNFDDLVLGNAADNWIYGNAGDDFIYGREGNDYLIGGAGVDTFYGGTGTDVLYGEGGADRFVFSNGVGIDYIMDFQVGGGDAVFIDVASLGLTSFAQVQARMVQSGNDTIIGVNGDSIIVLVGVTPAQLTAGEFLFG